VADHEKTFAGHPIGLVNLFFTEMWERFSYYGMRAILVLYMVAAVSDGGLAMTNKAAGEIYGLYTMCVYLSSLPGGLIADKILGARWAVLIGGIIITLGHFTIAFPSLATFYGGMLLIVVGTGLLKPNISSMLGMLYKEGDPRRDGGFSIFYMGINIGAMLAPLVCGYLAQGVEFKAWLTSIGIPAHFSWHWGFGAAGVGMMIGLVHYIIQWKQLGTAGLRPENKPSSHTDTVVQKEALTRDEWKRLGAIGVLFVFNILFWAIYEQGGSSLNIFADKCTDTTIGGWSFPSSWLQTFQATFVIIFAPLFSVLWLKLGEKQPTAPAKFAIGLFLLGLGIALMVPASILAAQGKVSPMWLIAVFLLQDMGELCLSPVGLSTVTKLAPARFVGLTMGAWFIGMALGNGVAGYVGGFFDEKNFSNMSMLFGSMAGATFVGTLILVALVPTVRKLMGHAR
jgi:POT family proton-dependent oligopeptide transporter